MDIMHVLVSPLALMGIMGGVFGVLLAIASVAFRVHQDERIGLIRAALPWHRGSRRSWASRPRPPFPCGHS